MTVTAELALASVGVTDPQVCHSSAPSLHSVAGPCELHV